MPSAATALHPRADSHQLGSHHSQHARVTQLHLGGAVAEDLRGGVSLACALSTRTPGLTFMLSSRLSNGRRPSTRWSSSSACGTRRGQRRSYARAKCRTFTTNSCSFRDRMGTPPGAMRAERAANTRSDFTTRTLAQGKRGGRGQLNNESGALATRSSRTKRARVRRCFIADCSSSKARQPGVSQVRPACTQVPC